jgi:hypothetical protein
MTSRVSGYFWVSLLFLLLLLGGGALRIEAGEELRSFSGVYRDERVTVELGQPVQSGERTHYSGAIQLGDQKFPLAVEAEENRLNGTFESDGNRFGFTGSVVGRMLVFTTDGTTYRLTKQVTNPLARPASKPNPLAQPRTNLPVVSNPSSSGKVTTLPPSKLGGLRFSRYSIVDDAAMIGGESFTALIPADWRVEGGVTWRIHPAVPASLALRFSNSNRTEVVETYPTIPFISAEGGIPLYPPGSSYLGYEVADPVEDPGAYVRQVILPRFRRNILVPQIAGVEDLVKVSDLLGENSKEPGLEKKFHAARVRFEYDENGRAMQEDFYCVMALAYAPNIHTTFWGPERTYSFKAEKGKLDARTRIFQTVISSVRPNLEWYNRYVQLVQVLSQSPLEGIKRVSELSHFIPRTTDEITDLRRQACERQQSGQERINARFAQYIRGVEEYHNPADNRIIQLPAGYSQVWTSTSGDYVLSEDSNFNPNTGSSKEWQPLERSR